MSHSTNIEETGFRAYTADSHLMAIETVRMCGAVTGDRSYLLSTVVFRMLMNSW